LLVLRIVLDFAGGHFSRHDVTVTRRTNTGLTLSALPQLVVSSDYHFSRALHKASYTFGSPGEKAGSWGRPSTGSCRRRRFPRQLDSEQLIFQTLKAHWHGWAASEAPQSLRSLMRYYIIKISILQLFRRFLIRGRVSGL
jgi:hypothetical protein